MSDPIGVEKDKRIYDLEGMVESLNAQIEFYRDEIERLTDQLQHEIENRLKLATSC